MFRSPVDACQGIVLLEWELISKLGTKVPPLSNNFTVATTLVPSLVFLMGRRHISPRNSLQLVGLGIAHNFVAGTSYRTYGLLQRLGAASLLVALNGESALGPSAAIMLWQFAILWFAQDFKTPFSSHLSTGQTRLDRMLVGEKHMLNPAYDPDGPLPTIMTAAAMWFGQWCADTLVTKNDSFISGVSLLSLGYMIWYAFPQQYPFSQTFWTLSFSIATSGISLLNYTAMDALCSALSGTRWGHPVVSLVSSVGAHSLELLFLSTSIDRSGILDRLADMLKGWRGKAAAAVGKCVVLASAALLLDRLQS